MFKPTCLRQIGFVSFLVLTVWYLGCQSGSSDSNGVTTPDDAFILGMVVEPPDEDESLGTEGQGAPPVADAGENQVVFDGTLVILDGSGSDPDGDPLTLTWTQSAGPPVTWSEDSPGTISFVAPDVDEDTHLEFTLSVSDGTFSADDTVSVEVMNTLTPADVGLPDVRFTVLLEDEGDPDVPLDGLRPLNVICTAATIDGQPLPEGTFTWMFDGVPETGPTDTHATRAHTFTAACAHTVALSLTVSGLTVGCLNTQSLSLEAHPTVWPSISGKVLDASDAGVSGATVSANAGGTTGVTGFDGSYDVYVPCGWSGEVNAQHVDFDFEPSSRSYLDVSVDLVEQDFEEPAGAPDSGGGGGNEDPIDSECNVDADCDNGLFCDGAETCVGGECLAGSVLCLGLCDEDNDVCVACLTDADCDDGLVCDAGQCVECSTDADCDDGLVCDAGQCVECSTDADCDAEAGETCVNNECTPPCTEDADCDDFAFCNGSETCVSGSCVAGADPCPGQSCDPINEVCVQVGFYYVAPDGSGSDSNDGSLESPWATIAHAKDQVVAGDTIYLRGGTHDASTQINFRPVENSNGTEANPITLKGYPGETAIIDGGSTPPNRLLAIMEGLVWWRFEDFTVNRSGSSWGSIHVEGGTNLVFANIMFDGSGGGTIGLRFDGTDTHDITVEDCTGHDYHSSAFLVHSGSYGISYTGCTAYNIANDGFIIAPEVESGDVTYTDCLAYLCKDSGFDLSGDVTLTDCVAWDNRGGGGGEVGFKLWDSQNRIVGGKQVLTRCVAYGYKENGARCISHTPYGTRDTNVELYNCTFVNNGTHQLYIDDDTAEIKVTVLVKNCIFSHASLGNSDKRALVVETGPGGSGLVPGSDYNCYHGNDDDVIDYRGTLYSAADVNDGTWFAAEGFDENSLSQDPLYMDFDNDDFHLGSGSPCIDAGVDLGLPYYGDAPDMGAFESGAP